MKTLLLLISFLFCFQLKNVPPTRFMTYNIRYDNAGDGVNQWSNRKQKVADLIIKYKPNIFGIQEGLFNQVQDLKKFLPEYNYVGVGRDDGKTKGEYSAIFYKKTEFKELKDSTFWLSATPNVPGSIGWDAAITRICTWAEFEVIKTDKRFFVFNTHFDHEGDTARINSAYLIIENAKRLANEYPYIIMGDFNSEPTELPYKIMTSSELGKMYDPNLKSIFRKYSSTYRGFEVSTKTGKRIDYIFNNGLFHNTTHYFTIEDNEKGFYPSDHLPVINDLFFNE